MCLFVCESVCPLPHSHTTAWTIGPGCNLRVGVGVSSSCALFGRFGIGARVSLLDNIVPNTKCQRVLVLALCLVMLVINSGMEMVQVTLLMRTLASSP